MNESKHDWLNDTPFDDGVWLDMLVDGELDQQQRSAFVAHVWANNDWQRVATAFLDGQVLRDTVSFEPASHKMSEVSIRPEPNRKWLTLLAMAACLVGGLMVGRLIVPSGAAKKIANGPKPVPQSLANENLSEPTVAKTGGAEFSLPGLFQVKDTPLEAVYYVDFSMPQFLLDALVLAGHKVSFDQEFLGYTESPDSPAAVPINVVRIEKYGRLLASAEVANPNSQ